MNKRIIGAIVQKDIKSTFASKKIWVPMIILSILLCTVVPSVVSYIGLNTELINQTTDKDIQKPINAFIEGFPNETMREKLAALPELGDKFVYFFLNFMLIPFFLMVAIINSLVTSSNSFAGEKERKTLETLLFAPISIMDLFLGKVIASFIPTFMITFLTFLINIFVINTITYSSFNEFVFLSSTWILLMFWVIPALVIFNIVLNVLISAKVKSFQEAQQFGGILVLPIVGLIISQATGLFFMSPMMLFIIGVALLVANGVLLKVITKFNQRNALFESQIH
ncbi:MULTISPECIES: ABC transporter permease subunit [unclassified Bacillus (in: firmicutes)]|uniref:ABC transporter permease subunit n=1 Tax=unclassified Bacillus (in: firmicutes) TaxID=185979 RepID=UPI0008EE6AF4|nr:MULTISPECIES: ABC transporter permease subunit [unclassified Bacillus (in: firmicutes)]SFB13826.1 ABC-2 family transporter protein [Bacillus sp. UNCCL13]SFQ89904.1 ABC-2 family transporter protein [Bacillus sp. cl95]